jgi:hypothetical protein
MQFIEDIEARWEEGYCYFMIMPDPIQPEQPRREFSNYSGNFFNICLTAWTSPIDIHLFDQLKHLVANVTLMMMRLKWRCGSF